MSGVYRRDSPEYEYALFHQSTEPDIFFDEVEKDEPRDVYDCRLVLTTIIKASNGNLSKLQAIMCLFAGLSLRESADICGKSHEYVRLMALSIKEEHPDLYTVLTNNVRGTVDSLIPVGKSKKWKLTNMETNKTIYVSNLSKYCRDNDWKIESALSACRRNQIFQGIKIERSY